MSWKNHIKLISRLAAVYFLFLPIAGTMGKSRAILLAGTAGLLYLIICFVADGKNSAD